MCIDPMSVRVVKYAADIPFADSSSLLTMLCKALRLLI